MFADFNEKFSLKYSDEVPDNYDVSEIRFVFDFVYLVYKRDASIDGALRGVANEYNLSQDYLRDYLIENKYILNRFNKKEILKQVDKLNTKSLKKLLKKNGLKASGKREKIIQRILDNKLLGNDYYLSSKSRIFYKNKKRRVKIYEALLEDYYYFDEFNEFYMNNFRKKLSSIPVDFINLYIDKAIEDKNHHMFVCNHHILADLFFEREDYKHMLEPVLKSFCINLNPVWKLDDLKNHGGLDIETFNELLVLYDELGKNRIISAYFTVWDSFNFEKIVVSKYAGYKYLKDILNSRDYSAILRELHENYYSNPDLKIKKIIQKTLFDF